MPIGSMYGIFTYIYHKNQPNVGEYTIHGSYEIGNCFFFIGLCFCLLGWTRWYMALPKVFPL